MTNAQNRQSKEDRGIADVLTDIRLDFRSSVVTGNRIFVMTPKSSSGVSPYLKDRIKEGISESIGGSKYQLVYQPFLEDNVAKKILVSDTAVRVQQFSTFSTEYNSMRSVLDTLLSYSVDIFVASRIQKSEEGDLIVHLQLVNAKNLEVLSTKSYHSNGSAVKTSKISKINVGVYSAQNPSTLAYRDYTNLSNGRVGPYNLSSFTNGAIIGVSQKLTKKGFSAFEAGMFIGAENSYIREGFIDTLYQNHTFTIPAYLIGVSLKAQLNTSDAMSLSVLSLEQRVSLGKSTLIDQYLVSETRLNVSLTQFLEIFGSIRFSQPVVYTSSVQQILEFQSYSLCYGISLNI